MFIVLPIGFLGTAGCQQKMADQPSYKPLEPCDFFADGRSERPAVPGTVARGHLHADVALFSGRREGKKGTPLGAATPAVVQPQAEHAGSCETRQGPVRPVRRYVPFSDDRTGPRTWIPSFHDLLCRVSRSLGHGAGQDRRARLYGASVVPYRATAKRARGLFVCRDQRRLRVDALLRRPNPRARPVGHCGLSSGAAGQPAFSRSEAHGRDAPRDDSGTVPIFV